MERHDSRGITTDALGDSHTLNIGTKWKDQFGFEIWSLLSTDHHWIIMHEHPDEWQRYLHQVSTVCETLEESGDIERLGRFPSFTTITTMIAITIFLLFITITIIFLLVTTITTIVIFLLVITITIIIIFFLLIVVAIVIVIAIIYADDVSSATSSSSSSWQSKLTIVI